MSLAWKHESRLRIQTHTRTNLCLSPSFVSTDGKMCASVESDLRQRPLFLIARSKDALNERRSIDSLLAFGVLCSAFSLDGHPDCHVRMDETTTHKGVDDRKHTQTCKSESIRRIISVHVIDAMCFPVSHVAFLCSVFPYLAASSPN